MSKHFILSPGIVESSKDAIKAIQLDHESLLREGNITQEAQVKKKLEEDDNLIHVEGRVIVKLDVKNKDSHTFSDGTQIAYERNFNNFNRRETQPVNVIVISGEGIPKNAEMLIDHNALHETNRINDYKKSFETAESDRIRYYSIPLYECFAWRSGNENWVPIAPFEFGLNVFRPYEGILVGVEPTQIKDTLLVTSGEYAGNVVKTLKGCDYVIIYQENNGKENYLLRFRPNGDQEKGLPEEAIAILHDFTDQVNGGKLLVGYSIKDAKPLKEWQEL